MALLDLFTRRDFTRRGKETPMPETTDTAAVTSETDPPLMRFLTAGGAVVELRTHNFRTNYTHLGRPYVSDEIREVKGYRWTCHGCLHVGKPNIFDSNYLPNERDKARNHANGHAETCRAMPRPTA